MDDRFSESFSGLGISVTHSTPTCERIQRGAESNNIEPQETVVIGESKDGDCLSKPSNNSSDSDWVTTTDTSVHSSPSTTRSVGELEVPLEVLEACDGMDEAKYLSPSPTSEVRRGRGKGKVIGRAVARNKRNESLSSRSSSSGDSESGSSSNSSSYDKTSSSHSTHSCSSTCSHSSSSSCCSRSSCCCSSCSSCSDSSCSCREDSDTSFESTDDLTDLPRAKTRSRRLGKMASLKVADRCTQS